MVTCKARPGFLEGEQNKIGSDVQVEISVEVDEHVEQWVRCAHVVREDGDRQQVSHEVFRTVCNGTQNGWSKLMGLVGGHVQEGVVPARRWLRARPQERKTKRRVNRMERLRVRCEQRTVCGQGKFKMRKWTMMSLRF